MTIPNIRTLDPDARGTQLSESPGSGSCAGIRPITVAVGCEVPTAPTTSRPFWIPGRFGEPTATNKRFGDLVGGMPSMPPLFFFWTQQKSPGTSSHGTKAGTNRLTFLMMTF